MIIKKKKTSAERMIEKLLEAGYVLTKNGAYKKYNTLVRINNFNMAVFKERTHTCDCDGSCYELVADARHELFEIDSKGRILKVV